MRLTILTCSKNNHKIKLCSDQLPVGMHPLDCKYTILSFPEMLIALTTCMGRWERVEGSVEKEGARIKRASHYLILMYIIYSG